MVKAKITPDKADEPFTVVKGSKDSKQKENRSKKLGKKPMNDAGTISAAIPVDPPATLNHRLRRNGETKMKGPPEPDSDATTRARPTKRLKRVHTNPSVPVNIKDPSCSHANITSKNLNFNGFLEPDFWKPPKPKRPPTSLYFADDEMSAGSQVRLLPRSRKARRYAPPNEANEQKLRQQYLVHRVPSAHAMSIEGTGSASKRSSKQVREKSRGR